MGRAIALLYGVSCYVIFFATFLYAIAFVGNGFGISAIAGLKTIDDGSQTALLPSIVINVLLLSLFAVQHSVMARPWFKERWTKIVPTSIERSTYVLIASAILLFIFAEWRPMTGEIWSIADGTLAMGLQGLSLIGWLILLFSTFTFNHFELFGLQQVFLNLRKASPPEVEFKKRHLYNVIRHPMMAGFIIAFWATPEMTAGHLLFAAVTTAYILVALVIEEGDLVEALGDEYEQYRKEVPMLIPGTKRKG